MTAQSEIQAALNILGGIALGAHMDGDRELGNDLDEVVEMIAAAIEQPDPSPEAVPEPTPTPAISGYIRHRLRAIERLEVKTRCAVATATETERCPIRDRLVYASGQREAYAQTLHLLAAG